LSAKSPVGCFFLDTCVLLSEILKENNPRIAKLKNDAHSHSIPCYVSDSVEEETKKKVKETTDFLGNAIKDTLLLHLEDSRKKHGISVSDPMTNDDIKALEELFTGFQSAIRTTSTALPNPLSLIEEWVISYLSQKLDKGTSISIVDFARELVKSVLQSASSIQDSYDHIVTFEKDFVKKKSMPNDSRITSSLEKLGIHAPDSNHIASAIVNQGSKSEKTVFVTLDFSTILNKRDSIKTSHGIDCSDPLYALHHLV
jgi:hypothetical protein